MGSQADFRRSRQISPVYREGGGGSDGREEGVGKGGRGGWDLEMDVGMAYGRYKVDVWRGVWVGGGDLDVEFPEAG